MIFKSAENKKINLLYVFALITFVITFFVFSFSFVNDFVDWDDGVNFVSNVNYRGLSLSNLKWMFTTFHMNHYQPLSWLTYGFDYCIWEMNPFGYHITAVFLHSLNAVLFFLINIMLFGFILSKNEDNVDVNSASTNVFPGYNPDVKDNKIILIASLFAALFFSLNPLRVESVSWITERRDVLSGLFYLMSLQLYLTRFRAPAKDKKFFYFSLLSFIAASLSKSMSVTLPAVLLLIDVYPLGRLKFNIKDLFCVDNVKVFLEKIPFFAVSIIISLITVFGAAKEYGITYPEYYNPSAAKALFAYGFYIVKTLLPFNLAPIYSTAVEGYFYANLFFGILLLSLVYACVKLRKQYPSLITAAAFYFITLSPACGLFNGAPQAAADRYSYLPMLGFAALSAGVVFNFINHFNSRRKILLFFMALMMICFVFLSVKQQKIWENSEKLWQHTLRVTPDSHIAHNNLSNWYYTHGDFKTALFHNGVAVFFNPEDSSYYNNAAKILTKTGSLREAAKNYEETIRLNPERFTAYFDAAVIYDKLGDLKKTRELLSSALEKKPDYFDAKYLTAFLMIKHSKYAQAEEYTGKMVNDFADSDAAYTLLCAAKAGLGKIDEAEKNCKTAININPENVQAADILRRIKR